MKRRSVGARTDRDTWVRIEARSFSKLTGQGSGAEGAAHLPRAVAKPEWYQGLSWQDPEQCVLWRADETELVYGISDQAGWRPQKRSGAGPGVVGDAGQVAGCACGTDHDSGCDPAYGPDLSAAGDGGIERVFPGRVEITVTEWAVAHADLAWANLTAPECWLLGWEDWGLAREVGRLNPVGQLSSCDGLGRACAARVSG